MQRYPYDRAYYRIRYPAAVQPTFIPLDGDYEFPVVDCSERGIRFAPQADAKGVASPGAHVRGQLRFHDGDDLYVSGVVVRIQSGEIAVHLTERPIPLKRILVEQIFLHRRFPFREQ